MAYNVPPHLKTVIEVMDMEFKLVQLRKKKKKTLYIYIYKHKIERRSNGFENKTSRCWVTVDLLPMMV